MAIDSAAKRRAASSVSSRSFGRPYRTPTAVSTGSSRARVAGFFYGAKPAAGLGSVTFTATVWQFLVEDIMAQRVIGQLPINGATYEDYLRRPGRLDGTMTLKDADANSELLDAGRMAVYVMRNGKIEWGGILQTPTVPLGAEDVQITCLGWLSWFDRRDIWTDRQFTATDQFAIMSTLVADAQNVGVLGVGADVGIAVSYSALSGVLRDRLQDYRDFLGKNLGTAMRELAAVENGFDYSMQFRVSDAGDKIEKTLLLSYPFQGQDRSTFTGFEYVRGQRSNVTRRGLARDASNMAWRIRGWGTGADVARMRSTQIDESLRGVYPFYDGQASFQSVVVQSTLDQNTGAVLATRGHVTVMPMLEVDPKMDPKWGTYGVGDIFHVAMSDGYASSNGAHRIVGYKMDVEKDTPTLFVTAAA